MAKVKFDFSECPLDPREISLYYNRAVSSIECKYSQNDNASYSVDFFSYSEKDVASEKNKLLDELSVQATLCLLSYEESRFRIDFIIRCQSRKKDFLTKSFRQFYKPAKRPYSYSLADDIIAVWKKFLPENKTIFDRFINAYNYRNWIAHGRYWNFKDNPRKFSFDAVWMLHEELDRILENHMLGILNIGSLKASVVE